MPGNAEDHEYVRGAKNKKGEEKEKKRKDKLEKTSIIEPSM